MTDTRHTLTDTIVRDARRRARHGEGVAALAREYGVNYHTLLAAVRGRTWTHLDLKVRPVPAAPVTVSQAAYHGGRRILTAQQVAAARRLVLQGTPLRVLADRYGVKRQVLYAAVRGTTWADMTTPPPVPYLTDHVQA